MNQPSSELTISASQESWNSKQRSVLAQLGIDRANDADLSLFFYQCVRTGLDPFARQIYMIRIKGRQTIQTGIDGFRLIARRACNARKESLGYEDTLWCGEDGKWSDVWLSETPPAAAKATVIRDGGRFSAIALYSEYVGRKEDGSVNAMWKGRPALMLAKCAEALALRKAFPQDLSGLYTTDEMNSELTIEGQQPAPKESFPTIDNIDCDLTKAETIGQVESIRAKALVAFSGNAYTEAEVKKIQKLIAAAKARVTSTPENVEQTQTVDDLQDYIANVNSQEDYDTVRKAIENSAFTQPIKNNLLKSLDAKADNLANEPFPELVVS